MRSILSAVLPAVPYFSTLHHKQHCFRKSFMNIKFVFLLSLQILSEKIFPLRRNERDMIKYVYWSSCKVSVILVSLMKLEFSRQIFKKCSDIKFHENPSIGNRVVPSGRTDGRTDITKLIVVLPILRTRLKMFVGYCIKIPALFACLS
jgi:hypothetical protein